MFWLLRMVYFEDSRFFCVSLKIICFCYTRQLTWLESNYIPSLGWQLKCQLNSFILSWSLYYIYVVLRSGWVYTQNFGSPSLAHFFPRSPKVSFHWSIHVKSWALSPNSAPVQRRLIGWLSQIQFLLYSSSCSLGLWIKETLCLHIT